MSSPTGAGAARGRRETVGWTLRVAFALILVVTCAVLYTHQSLLAARTGTGGMTARQQGAGFTGGGELSEEAMRFMKKAVREAVQEAVHDIAKAASRRVEPTHEPEAISESPEARLDRTSQEEANAKYESLEDHIRQTAHPRCQDAIPGTTRACHGPPIPAEYADLLNKTGCDMFTVPFDPSNDARCLALLSTPSRWKGIRPMSQSRDMRTIKFWVEFEDSRLSAIIKVPQQLFKHEAHDEVAAFVADRVLQQNRVPPTAWTYVPVQQFHDVVAKHGASEKLVDNFAKDSGVSTWADWVEKDFLKWNAKKKYVRNDDPNYPGEDVVGVSVQLYVAEVRPLLQSDLVLPWELHKDTWMQHLTPTNFWHPWDALTWVRQVELAMFDWVVGNFDRSPNKNNFVVGGCVAGREGDGSKCGYPRHPGPPTFVTLDNGLAFHYPNYVCPDGEHPMKKDYFCVFEKRLMKILLQYKHGDFSARMMEAMPERLKSFFPEKVMSQADERLDKLIERYHQCVEKFGEARVLVA